MKKHLLCLALLSFSLNGCAYIHSEEYDADMKHIENTMSNNADNITALEARLLATEREAEELATKVHMNEAKLILIAEQEKKAMEEKALKEKAAEERAKAKANVKPAKKPAPSISKITSKQLTEKQAYEEALRFYQTGRFTQAHKAFLAFRETYPTTKYAANAIYWSGESYYAQEKYSQAILQFKDLITRFPQNNKVPDALLKIALSYQKLADNTSASIHTTVLFEDWPNSDAAKKARKLNLQTISQ